MIETDTKLRARFKAQFGTATNPDPCAPETPTGRMTKFYSDWAADVGVFRPLTVVELVSMVARLEAGGWTDETHVGLNAAHVRLENTLKHFERHLSFDELEGWVRETHDLPDDLDISSFPREVLLQYLT